MEAGRGGVPRVTILNQEAPRVSALGDPCFTLPLHLVVAPAIAFGGTPVFVVAILLFIAAVVLYFVARAQDSKGLKLGALGAVIAGLFSLITSMTYVISAYEVGVPVAFGKVGTPMTSGLHLKSPFTNVTTFSTRPVDLNLSDKDVVEVRSRRAASCTPR